MFRLEQGGNLFDSSQALLEISSPKAWLATTRPGLDCPALGGHHQCDMQRAKMWLKTQAAAPVPIGVGKHHHVVLIHGCLHCDTIPRDYRHRCCCCRRCQIEGHLSCLENTVL